MMSDSASDPFRGCVALVAAHNEEATIGAVVAGARQVVPAVIVVDDGSTDHTRDRAAQAGAVVVHHEARSGYDRALMSGFAYARAQGFEYMATLDGDGQHDPRLLEGLLLPLVHGEADLVIGYRPSLARPAERVFALYTRVRFGVRDPLCGMKGYRVSMYELADERGLVGSVGTGLALRALRGGARLHEVPIPIQPRWDASRFGIGLRANIRILGAMWMAMIGWSGAVPQEAVRRSVIR